MSPQIGEDLVPTPVIPLTRRATRSLFVPKMNALIAVRPSFRAEKVLVRDISMGGIGLVTPHPLDIGDVISVQFLASPWADLGGLIARVVYVMPERDSSWRVGCAFARSFKRNELGALLTEWADRSLKYE